MAEIEEALRTYLLTKTTLTTIVSTRIYAEQIDGGTLPAVQFIKISDVKDHTFDGQQALERPVFQFSGAATTKTQARSTINAIKAALCDYAGTLSGVDIQYIRLLNETSGTYNTDSGKVYYDDAEFEINFIRS
jgi:hypothetical protein